MGSDGTWSAFHNGVVELREGDPLKGRVDLRDFLPVEVRGVLSLQVPTTAVRLEDHRLVFRPDDETRVAVITGLRFVGRKESISGPGVAGVREGGQFSILLQPGDYKVDVVDMYGEDLGLARQTVTCRPAALMQIVATPRVLYIGANNTHMHGVPEVLGPDGACAVTEHGRRGAAVFGVRAGRYRVIWRDSDGILEREIVVSPEDVDRQLPDLGS